MKWADYTPLFAIIVVILAMAMICILAVLKDEIPSFITTAATVALGALFVGSSVRGTQPPDGSNK